MRMFYTLTMLLNDANTYSSLSQRWRSACRICFNSFLGRSQMRAIRRTIVKTTVCQNGGASLLLNDKNVWPTEKQQTWSHFYCWRLLATSERRHIYSQSYPILSCGLSTGITKRPAIACKALKLCWIKIIVMLPEFLLAVMHREMKVNKLV